MYAMIFESGTQLTLTAGDVYNLSYDKDLVVTRVKSNGAQTVFTASVAFGERYEVWQIFTNCHSQGEQDMFACYNRNA